MRHGSTCAKATKLADIIAYAVAQTSRELGFGWDKIRALRLEHVCGMIKAEKNTAIIASDAVLVTFIANLLQTSISCNYDTQMELDREVFGPIVLFAEKRVFESLQRAQLPD